MYNCYITVKGNKGIYLITKDHEVLYNFEFRVPNIIIPEYIVLIDLLDKILELGLESLPIKIYTKSKKLVDQMLLKKDCGDLYWFWYEASASLARIREYVAVEFEVYK